MGFLNPLFFSLSIFIGAVLVFYMFRKQYENRVIPSTFLWQQVMDEWQASPWLDKLQRNLLLFLQLLALTLLMFALVKPFLMVRGIPGEHIIFIIDHSASMATTHNGKSRFEEAMEKVNEYVKQIDGQEVTLITAGSEPELLLIGETDLTIVKQVINDIQLSYEYGDIKKAIRLADSLASQKNSSVYIFSDAVTANDLDEISEDLFVTVINNGENGANISLRSFGTGQNNDEIIGVAVVENQSAVEQTVQFQVQSNEQLLFEQSLVIEPMEQQFIKVPDLPEREYYVASVIVNDDYKVDNELIAIQQSTLTKIYALGEVSPFVLRGLENIGYDVIQLKSEFDEQSLSDGMIVTEKLEVENWPNRPMLAITPSQGELVPLQQPINITSDPLFHYVNFDKVYVSSIVENRSLQLPIIAESGGYPLLQKGLLNGQPSIVIHFPIESSDWPLHPGFPIFLYHSTQWLSAQDSFFGFFQPGEERWINVEETEWNIFDASGNFIQSLNVANERFVAPQMPGLYQVTVNGKRNYFTVYLDEREKEIPYEPSFTVNELSVDGDLEDNSDIRPYDQLWLWLAILALIILFVEWEVTRRGSRV